MSEQTNLRPQEVKVPVYKTAVLPWCILVSIAIATVFFIAGSFYEKEQQGVVEAKASAMVQELTVKPVSK